MNRTGRLALTALSVGTAFIVAIKGINSCMEREPSPPKQKIVQPASIKNAVMAAAFFADNQGAAEQDLWNVSPPQGLLDDSPPSNDSSGTYIFFGRDDTVNIGIVYDAPDYQKGGLDNNWACIGPVNKLSWQLEEMRAHIKKTVFDKPKNKYKGDVYVVPIRFGTPPKAETGPGFAHYRLPELGVTLSVKPGGPHTVFVGRTGSFQKLNAEGVLPSSQTVQLSNTPAP